MQARMKHPVVIVPDAMKALPALPAATKKSRVPDRTLELIILRASGILPEYLCQDMRSDPHFRVTELPQQREVWLLIQKHLKRDPNTRAVIDWLRSCFLRDRTTAVPQRR